MLKTNEIQRYSKRDVFRFLSLQTCAEKIPFRLISFKKNNPNHITAKEKIQERFHGKKYMLFTGWEVRIVKNCDRGLENAARGRRPRAAFSRQRSQFFTIRTDPKPVNNLFIFFLLG